MLFRLGAGNLHQDHGTIAHFRKAFLSEIQDLFVWILLLGWTAGVLKLRKGVQVSTTILPSGESTLRGVLCRCNVPVFNLPDEQLRTSLSQVRQKTAGTTRAQ